MKTSQPYSEYLQAAAPSMWVGGKTMKAITLIQPWASLIADGIKDVETRSWPTSYRGLLAIHAGYKVDAEACYDFDYSPETITRGHILAIVNLADCVRFPNAKTPPDPWGDFTPGRYGFMLDHVSKLSVPIPSRGMLGLWEWTPPADFATRIVEQAGKATASTENLSTNPTPSP